MMPAETRKTLLMVALDYPPCQSAGVQRTYKFAQYLQSYGWDVVVLTVKEQVYERCDHSAGTPEVLHVERCAAIDAARDLAWRGKYLGFSCVPDRWWSWALTAIPAGKKLIARFKPDVIWSTYPVSTAHFIAYRLQQSSGLPWIADYRDPLQCRYDPSARRYSGLAKWIEKQTIKHCSLAVFTTDNAAKLYQRLYPQQLLRKFRVIENGFDEENFRQLAAGEPVSAERFRLLHSGALYGDGRDPTPIFRALSLLKQQGKLNAQNFVLSFRGCQAQPGIMALLSELAITELVEFLPGVSYLDSLTEMLSADALLLLQGPLFNNQIPSKLYDYIRAGRPILAMTPAQSATARALAAYPQQYCAMVADELAAALAGLLDERTPAALVTPAQAAVYSRYSRTAELAALLAEVCAATTSITLSESGQGVT